jgi:hypothetical protein
LKACIALPALLNEASDWELSWYSRTVGLFNFFDPVVETTAQDSMGPSPVRPRGGEQENVAPARPIRQVLQNFDLEKN